VLAIRVGDDEYGLDDPAAAELIERLEPTDPDDPGARSTYDKLSEAMDADGALQLDDADLALIGVVLEAWALEVEGDLPGDVLELRYAISDRLD
jgi:hypothetical protein